MKIHLYTEPGCAACTEARSFLQSCGVLFEERDVRSRPEYLRILEEDLDSCTLPTLMAGDTIITGFDREEYQLLSAALIHNHARPADIEVKARKAGGCRTDSLKGIRGEKS